MTSLLDTLEKDERDVNDNSHWIAFPMSLARRSEPTKGIAL
jgi:hypothetical protein